MHTIKPLESRSVAYSAVSMAVTSSRLMWFTALCLIVSDILSAAVAQTHESTLPSNCKETVWQAEYSLDNVWKATSSQVVCDLGLSSSASAVVKIGRGPDMKLQATVLGMDLPSDPADEPRIQWISPTKLMITVAAGSMFASRVAEYQGIQIDVRYCPDDPKLNQQMIEWRTKYQKWIQDTSIWTEKKKADPMFREPKPTLPLPPNRPKTSSCDSLQN